MSIPRNRPSGSNDLSRGRQRRRARAERTASRPAPRAWSLEELEERSLLATFTVTNTNDTGLGSLRQAIVDANSAVGLDTIAFSIGSGVQTIQPASALPAIADHVLIDGTTQPGYSLAGTPLIELDGSLAGPGADGLLITSGGSTVRGLVIDRWSGNGIQLTGGGGNVIQGNYIGTDVTGSLARGNGSGNVTTNGGLAGVLINSSANNLVGGTAAADRNVISGNDRGVQVDGIDVVGAVSTGNLIQGNYIGTDATGINAVGNFDGVSFDTGASNNTVGGTAPGAGNLVSGNIDDGVQFTSGSTTGNLVQGNLIGTDASGVAALGNNSGVLIQNAPGNQIGGATAAAANVISGNRGGGIVLAGTLTTGNVILGNFIGTDATGTLILGNSQNGVLFTNNTHGSGDIHFPTNNTIGGTVLGAGNTIAGSAGVGVDVAGGTGDAILGNAIWGNSGLGIDLRDDGVTSNSGNLNPGKPNNGMDYPVFTSATENGTTLTLAGYVGSSANQPPFAGARVEVFRSDNDPSGFGQGQVYLGFLTTDASGNFSGSLPVSGLGASDRITGTATDPGNNTSEFAANVLVQTTRSASGATVVSSANPSTYGQGVTFTANIGAVAPATGTPTGTVTFLDGSTSLGTVPLSGGVATLTTSALAAGSHSITVRYNGDSLFFTTTSTTLIQSVAPATLTVTANNASRVYGQANPALTVSYSGFVNGENTSVLAGAPALSTAATFSSGVGAYTIAATQGSLGAANYTFAFQPGSLNVTPAALTVFANNASRPIAQANPAFTASYVGFVNGDTPGSLGGVLSFTTAATVLSLPGTYPVTPGGLTSANYSITFVDGTLTVTAGVLNISTTSLVSSSNPSTYGQAVTLTATVSPVVSLTGTPTGTVTFLDGSTSLGTVTLSGGVASLTTSALAAGSHSITAQYNGDSLFVLSASTPLTQSVTPATLTITANNASRVYGQANPPLTASYSGFVNGDTTSVLTGAPALSTAATPTSGVGAYTIAATQGSLGAANYTFAFQPGSLSVTRAILTVTANNASRMYGQANPAFTASYSGFVNGENTSVLTGAPGVSTIATPASGVGAYTIAATQGSLGAANYTFAFQPGSLNITPAALAITANDASRGYGQANPAFTVSFSGFLNGDTASVVSGVSASTNATPGSGVGGYPITPGGASAANYTISYASGTLTIVPAVLTVTADNLTTTYGASLPALTYTTNGLVGGDTSSVFTGGLATSATAGSAAGSYGITQGNLSAGPNYTIAFHGGTLAVNRAALTVTANDQTRQYGGGNPSFSAQYAGFVNGDTPVVLGGVLGFSTAAGATSPVGRYAVTPGGLVSGNYAIAFAAGTLTVTPAPLVVRANDAVKEYGQPNPSFSATFNGLVGDDTPASLGPLGFATAAGVSSPSGRYAVTPLGLGTTNYAVDYQAGTLTVVAGPFAASGVSIRATEGTSFRGVVATFNDGGAAVPPAGYTAIVDWGDGSVSPGTVRFDDEAQQYLVEGTHTFATAGLDTTHVSIRADQVVAATATGSAVVADAPLRVAVAGISATEGVAFAGVVGSFIDAGPLDPPGRYTVTIDWGDGHVSPGTIHPDGGGHTFTIEGSNTYAADGVYAVRIVVRADAGAAGSAMGLAVVAVEHPGAPDPPGEAPTTGGQPPSVALGPPAVDPVAAIGAPVAPAAPGPVLAPVGLSPAAPGRVAQPTAAPPTAAAAAGSGTVTAPAAPPPLGNAHAHGENAAPDGPSRVIVQGFLENAIAIGTHQLAAFLDALARSGRSVAVLAPPPAAAAPAERGPSRAALDPPSAYLWEALDGLETQVDSGRAVELMQAVLGSGAVAYVGYVLLKSRIGSMLLTVLTAHPLWAEMDPLAILVGWDEDQKRRGGAPAGDADEEEDDEEDQETLQSLIEESQGGSDAETVHDADQPGPFQPHTQRPPRRVRARPAARPRVR